MCPKLSAPDVICRPPILSKPLQTGQRTGKHGVSTGFAENPISPDRSASAGVSKRQVGAYLWFLGSVGLGLAASTGHLAGILLSVGMPFACSKVPTRAKAFEAAFAYFASGLWPIIPGLQRYLGSSFSPAIAVGIWFTCAAILACPWAVAWTSKPPAFSWRVPATLLLTTAPPLGLINFLSPLVSAGILFPGFGWTGLLLTALLPGLLLSSPQKLMPAIISAVFLLSAAAHLCANAERTIPGWQAIDTHFGNVSLPLRDYEVAQFIQERAGQSPAQVLIFPEFLIPRWSETTELFWSRTLIKSRNRGQILIIGAGVPRRFEAGTSGSTQFDFESSIAALRSNGGGISRFSGSGDHATPEPFDNSLLILGSQTATFYQRVPVPLGMWRPFNNFSVPLRLNGPGVVVINHERAAPLICYEQLIVWPVLASMIQRPTVLVGISNTFWFNGTAIPRYQLAAMRAWARLFAIPLLSAVNS